MNIETPVFRPVPATPSVPLPERRWRARWAAPWRQGGLRAAYASATGRAHSRNEDCCSHVPSADKPGFVGVADGVGGGAHGEIASSVVLSHCARAPREIWSNPGRLVAWLAGADAEVRKAIALRTDQAGAATLAAAWFPTQATAYVLNVGDCRAYQLKPARPAYLIQRLTTDQTYASLAQQPPPNGQPDDPARMVGAGAVGTPPVVKAQLGEGDLLLLCSDGVHKFVPDERIAELVTAGLATRRSLEELCTALVDEAKANGGQDDASALLVMRRPRVLSRWVYGCAVVALLVLSLLAGAHVAFAETQSVIDPTELPQAPPAAPAKAQPAQEAGSAATDAASAKRERKRAEEAEQRKRTRETAREAAREAAREEKRQAARAAEQARQEAAARHAEAAKRAAAREAARQAQREAARRAAAEKAAATRAAAAKATAARIAAQKDALEREAAARDAAQREAARELAAREAEREAERQAQREAAAREAAQKEAAAREAREAEARRVAAREAARQAAREAAQRQAATKLVASRGYRPTREPPRFGTVFRDCAECPELVWLPEGDFRPEGPGGTRSVASIDYMLAVGRFEVTFAEWDACVAARECRRPSDSNWGRGRQPVIDVTWDEARQYTEWLSRRTGKRYRLLTEAEWEYAARAGTDARYWWGDEARAGVANCSDCGTRWDGRRPAPVGSFPPNPFGLHDMHGNVWEWVADCAFECAGRDTHIVRGGAWQGPARAMRSAARSNVTPGFRDNRIGFRVAREE